MRALSRPSRVPRKFVRRSRPSAGRANIETRRDAASRRWSRVMVFAPVFREARFPDGATWVTNSVLVRGDGARARPFDRELPGEDLSNVPAAVSTVLPPVACMLLSRRAVPPMQINFGSSSRGSGGAPAVAGRLGGTLFGLAFAAIGLAVAGMVGAAWMRNARVYGWRPSECLVTASRVEEHPGAPAEGEQYKLVVEYRYPDPADPSGGERTGSVVSPSYRGSSDIESAQELAARYPQGARVACFVDPADPGNATLRRPSLWFGLALLVPLLFVLFGLGLAVGVWRRARANAESPAGEALSRSAAGGSGAGCIVLFFALFLLAGLGALGFFVRPVLRLLSAGSRIEVPATVLYSGVREHSGDDSTTYGVEVLYAYEVGGRTYKSTRYDFSSGSSSGRESKAAKVAAIPAGTRTICYVDPRHPEDAVLDRAFRPIYLLGLIPLVFVAVGGIGMAAALRYRQRKAAGSGAPDWLPQPRALGSAVGVPEAAEGGVAEGPILLAPKSEPWGRFLGITFVALFWNGLVSVFLYQVVQGWRSGQGDGCLTAFLVPFVLVGLALI